MIAPDGKKTLPSQALAVSLSHATVDRPTPESVAALAEALRVVEHAGIEKKLDRDLRAARKALGASARLVPRARGATTKAQRSKELTAFRAAIEAAFDAPPRPSAWLAELLADPVLGPAAADLVWTVSRADAPGRSGRWREGALRERDGTAIDLAEDAVVLPDGAVDPARRVEPAAAIPLPWLPYDEGLLELLVRQALALLAA